MEHSESEAVDTLKSLLRRSEYIKAFDFARRAVESYPDALRLRHGGVLALARMGASARARALFLAWGLDRVGDDEDVLSLWARLAKDEAKAAGAQDRRPALLSAASAYRQAYEKGGGGYFPAINVASLLLLAGDVAAASEWAETARSLADGGDDYFSLATVAEAHLVDGDADRAASVLADAAKAAGDDYASMSTTRAQLAQIIAARDLDPAILDVLAPPAVAHFCGHMIARDGAGRFPEAEIPRVAAEIDAAIRDNRVGFAMGSLAAGADILFAEALLRAGAEVGIVLPFEKTEFIEVSVRSCGAPWVERFHRCLDAAKDVHFVTEDAYLGHDELFNYASHYALGLGRLRSQMLGAPLCQLAVWDGQPSRPGDLAGTAVDLARGQSLGLRQHIIRSKPHVSPAPLQLHSRTHGTANGRKSQTMIFGDLKGFSKLTDQQLPSYVDTVLGTCAKAIAGHADSLRFHNTWGDGLFLVFDDLAEGAACAFSLQTAIAGIDHDAAGLPDTLGLRLGMHYGPVFEIEDPVLRRPNYFGYHVSRAARVEPITPEGEVYATEAAAAALMVDEPDRFRCDYVGRLPLAKGYGEFPMYALTKLR